MLLVRTDHLAAQEVVDFLNTFDCPDEDWAHFTLNTPSVTKASPDDPTKQPLNPAKAFINPGKFGTIPARLFAIDEMWEIFFGVRPCNKCWASSYLLRRLTERCHAGRF